MRVLAFAGSRADLFPLGSVLVALSAAHDLHLATAVGLSGPDAVPLLAQAGLRAGSFSHHDLGCVPASSSTRDLALAAGELAVKVAELISRESPSCLVVLGDRWEMVSVVLQAVQAGVPIVHLHGGEITGGAVDERYRHAVTKLADWHCVATEGAAERVRQLGEPDDRIAVTGAPGLDRLTDVTPLTDDGLAELLGCEITHPLILFSYHPVTAGDDEDPGSSASMILDAALAAGGTVIATDPGQDTGREDILAELRRRVGTPGFVHRPVLGGAYARVLASCDAVIGNSSSGIIEAASFGVPVLDIGTRQAGREKSSNVRTVPAVHGDVVAGIAAVVSGITPRRAGPIVNVYGDGHAARRIVDVVEMVHPSPKRFVTHRIACDGD